MNKYERGMLDDIHRVLVGDLDNAGFIEETKSEGRKRDYRLDRLEKMGRVKMMAMITIATGVIGKLVMTILV